MFRIRDFSRFTRVSVKMLRRYDRLGLLKPAHVDPSTRYRYYSARQLTRLQRILALRDLGFSLERIAQLLDARASAFRRALTDRRVEIERRIDEERQRLAQIEARLDRLSGREQPALPDAVLRELPARRVASRRARVADLDDPVTELFEAVERDAAAAGIRAAGPPLLLYHDRDHREVDADVEAAVPVNEVARRAGRSTVRLLPAVPQAACVVYAGNYDQATAVMRGLLAWLEARALVPAGPAREVFLQFGTRGLDQLRLPAAYLAEQADDFVTELQVPVRAREGAVRGRARRAAAKPAPRRSKVSR